MFSFAKNRVYPIGLDMESNSLTLAQLKSYGNHTHLIAGEVEYTPDDICVGSSDWQKWAVEFIKKAIKNGKFRGKNVTASMPASGIFIDHIKMPDIKKDDKLSEAILSIIKPALPFEPEQALVKHIPVDEHNIVVIATNRQEIERHLAICENAKLQIKSIVVWPLSLLNIYTRFFGRRKSDRNAVVMLLEINTNHTNVVVCRHQNLLFARCIRTEGKYLENEKIAQLITELTTCRRYVEAMHKDINIERAVFLSSRAGDMEICTAIARELDMPAQIGNCLEAVKVPRGENNFGIDRRNCQVNWTRAFSLSLS